MAVEFAIKRPWGPMAPGEASASRGAFTMADLRDRGCTPRFIVIIGILGFFADFYLRRLAQHRWSAAHRAQCLV
jgi:hypothetical protein